MSPKMSDLTPLSEYIREVWYEVNLMKTYVIFRILNGYEQLSIWPIPAYYIGIDVALKTWEWGGMRPKTRLLAVETVYENFIIGHKQ